MTDERLAVGKDSTRPNSRFHAWACLFSEWMGRRGLVLAAFLTPLAVASQRHESFATPKLLVLAVAALLALGIWRGFVPRVIAPGILVAGGVLGLATLFSTERLSSLLGGPLHSDGIVAMVLITVVLLGAAQARAPKDIEESLVAAGALASLYGVAQAFGFDPMKWSVGPEYGNAAMQSRAFATFGSPGFMGLFCACVLPLAVTVAVRRPRIGMAALVSVVLGLFATQSRAAVLAAFVGVLLVAFRMVGRHRRVATLTLVGVLLAFPFTAVAERFRATNPVERSVAVRIELWKTGVQAAKQRPVLGFGPGTTSHVIDQFAGVESPPEVRTHPSAHNLALDIALSTGALGLLAFLVVGFAALRPLWTHPVLFAGLAAWGVGVSLGFSDIPTSTAAALMLGMGLREEPTLKWNTRPLTLATLACAGAAAWLYLTNR